jgi:HNH endonuclease
MRIELIMVILTGICILNVYYNGMFFKWIMQQKKYFQIGGILLLSFSVYLMIKRNPNQAKNILLHANNYIKYMPVNKNTIDHFSNILDFTPVNETDNPITPSSFVSEMNNIFSSDKPVLNTAPKHKRSVSETKKKYVASMQDWKCGSCKEKLNAWYEIDHKKRLEYGGTNNVDNLIALCRECHGQKTAMENM